ncbi:unnamed protein product, partial [Ixodes persulcatus]
GKKGVGGATPRRVLASAEEAVCVFWGSEDRPWRWIQKWISCTKAQRVIRKNATGYRRSLTFSQPSGSRLHLRDVQVASRLHMLIG